MHYFCMPALSTELSVINPTTPVTELFPKQFSPQNALLSLPRGLGSSIAGEL